MSTVQNVNTIVSNRLVLYLDAGNIASYPGTGTLWTDLNPYKNNATLYNGVGFSSTNRGSLSFDGTDDYVAFTATSEWNFAANNFTIEMWIKLNSLTSNNPRLFKTSNDGNISGISIVNPPSSNNLLIYMSSNGSTYDILNGAGIGSITFGQFSHLVITRVGATLNIYINNVLTGSANIASSSIYYTSTPGIAIGGTVGGGRSILGNIALFKMYNKGLSATEVAQNYNALKSRYI